MASALGHDIWTTPDELPSEPSDIEAEQYLALFRVRMLPYFPFVHFPDATVTQLRQEQPFFFRAIVAVASPSMHERLARGKELKRLIVIEAILNNKSNMDLLLGLLTYIAWGYDQFLTKSGTLSRLTLLATSIIYDLRLNKPLPQDAHMIAPLTTPMSNSLHDASTEPDPRLLERPRAVLGCFILSSTCVFSHPIRHVHGQ